MPHTTELARGTFHGGVQTLPGSQSPGEAPRPPHDENGGKAARRAGRDGERRWPAPRERRGPSEPTPGKQWRERDVGRGRRRRAGKGLRPGGGGRARGVRHPGVLRPRARGRIRVGVGALRKGRRGRAAGAAGSRTPPRILHSPLARSSPAPIPPPSFPPRCRRTHRPRRTAAILARNCRSRLGARPPRPRRPGTAPSSRPARDQRSVPYSGCAAKAGHGDALWRVGLPQPLTGSRNFQPQNSRGSPGGDAPKEPNHFLWITTAWRFACALQQGAGYPAPI